MLIGRNSFWIAFAICLFSLFNIVACGKNSEDGLSNDDRSAIYATVPDATTCSNPVPSQHPHWPHYQQSGFVPYSWSSNHANSQGGWHHGNRQPYPHPHPQTFPPTQPGTDLGNGCPPGFSPACDAQLGRTCAPVSGLLGHQFAWLGWQNGARQFGRCGFSSYEGYSGCSSPMVQTCLVGTRSCGLGAICQPTLPNGTVGICVRLQR